MNDANKNRLTGIDILKVLAVFFVVGVHFFLYTKYLDTPVAGLNMLLQSAMRWIFITCVPIFLMCTGFLENGKQMTRSYYKKLLRILIVYVLISVICLIYRRTTGELLYPTRMLSYITRFTADGYAWYVNMYIGLFLLIPLLNLAVKELDRKRFLIVLFSLVFVIAVPLTINPITDKIRSIYFITFPDWWTLLFPIMYYMIGAFLSKYPVRVRKPVCFSVLVGTTAALTALLAATERIGLNREMLFVYGSLPVLIESVLVFLLFYDIRIGKAGVKKALALISNLTFEIFLFSYISDQFLYAFFHDRVFNSADGVLTQQQIFVRYFFIIVSLSFLASLLFAYLVRLIYRYVEKGFGNICKSIKQRRKTAKLPPDI